jgi:hypothetical protein
MGLAAVFSISGAVVSGQLEGRILSAGDHRVLILSSSGEITWEYPTKLTHDAWAMPNGNVLFADGETVTEVTPAKQIVFQYRPSNLEGGGVYSCQRLADGNTLAGENSTGRVLELTADGKAVFALQTTPFKAGDHHNMRMARKLANGNYLVCHSGARLVKEYSPKGEVLWEVKAPGPLAFSAVRTTEGNTLVSSLEQITDYDSAGRVAWQCYTHDLTEVPVRNLTGFHRLANGNLVVGCYQAYRDGKGAALLEISREKRIIWHYSNPQGDNTMMPVQLLSPEGTALAGPCLR